MGKCHHLQLQKQPLLSHDFKGLNSNAAASDCPVIQEEVQKILAKGY